MTYSDSDVEQYFDLIVQCADKLERERPLNTHPQAFWREEVGKQWRLTYQHMSRPVDGGLMWRTDAYKRELAMKFAALSRLAAMAAWAIETHGDPVEQTGEKAAEYFTEVSTQSFPRIR